MRAVTAGQFAKIGISISIAHKVGVVSAMAMQGRLHSSAGFVKVRTHCVGVRVMCDGEDQVAMCAIGVLSRAPVVALKPSIRHKAQAVALKTTQ